MLPPRKPKSKLEIVLWGSPARYYALLARRGADMANPAFYSPLDNTVMAGLELSQFTRRLNEVRSFHEEVQQQAEQDRTQIRRTSRKLQQQGVSPEELQEMNLARRQRIDRESGQMLRDLEMAAQRATFQLQQASQRTFAMLYHEAFHAYLENYVYPHDRYDVPRWLNEGFAQIFENGQLEGDTLHFDGPAQRYSRNCGATCSAEIHCHSKNCWNPISRDSWLLVRMTPKRRTGATCILGAWLST